MRKVLSLFQTPKDLEDEASNKEISNISRFNMMTFHFINEVSLEGIRSEFKPIPKCEA